MNRQQQTLSKPVEMVGKALHSGRIVKIVISPATANHGIRFQRSDVPGALPIKALASEVSDTRLSTAIGSSCVQVSTIEHLMAAFSGLGVDNALVMVDGPELPILDGSSSEFVKAISLVGLKKQNEQKNIHLVKDVLELREGDKFIRVEPSKKLRFDVSIDFGKNSYIGRQILSWTYSQANFWDIAVARTFCHLNEVDAMKEQGLALGGSLQNAVVVTDNGVLNADGLRATDEFVRHKLLDFMGDLMLVGFPVIGKFTIHKPGHSLNARFAETLLNNKHRFLGEVANSAADSIPVEERVKSPLPIYAT